MKKIIINFVFAAVLFCAAGGASAFAATSYEHCRCNQTTPGLTDNTTTCCNDAINNSYQNSNKDTCCKNVKGSTYSWTGTGTTWSSSGCTVPDPCAGYTSCKATIGGYVTNAQNPAGLCTTCCGGNLTGAISQPITCNGTSYFPCACKTSTTTVALFATSLEINDSTGTNTDDTARSYLGVGGSGAVNRCTQRGETGGHDAIFRDTYNTCMSEFGTVIQQYLNANSGGFSNICYIGGGNTVTNGGSTYTNVGIKYYLGCVVK
ncbi:MAG: hypothetical protein LBI01_01085 [Elusimicrobium sp.]|nr:hypothetical protein [Elusimicrobium sp.]